MRGRIEINAFLPWERYTLGTHMVLAITSDGLSRTQRTGRGGPFVAIVSLVMVAAFVLAPLIVALTHPPVSSHDHAHYHADEAQPARHGVVEASIEDRLAGAASVLPGHDATDHDHTLHALLAPRRGAKIPPRLEAGPTDLATLTGHARDGPDRPPRA